MKRTILLVLSLLLAAVMITSCGQEPKVNPEPEPTPTPTSYGVFMVGETKYRSLQKAVNAVKNANTAKAASVPTIVLTGDVEDAGAVIDIDVNLDFGSYTYTLKGSDTGIKVVKDETHNPSVSVTGGKFVAANNTTDSLFVSNGELNLSGVAVNLAGSTLNALNTTGGSTSISGSSITVADNKNIVVASDTSSVSVVSGTGVSLKGSFDLSGSAVVNLSDSSVCFTSPIIKADSSWSLTIGETTINIETEGFNPVISKDTNVPKSLFFATIDGTVLDVSCESNTPFVTYQWYSNTTDSAVGGTPIKGATEKTLNYKIKTKGLNNYFYCVATNALDSTKTAVSTVVRVYYTGLPTLYATLDDSTIDVFATSGSYSKAKDYPIYKSYQAAKFMLSTGDVNEIQTTPISIKGRGNTSWTDTTKRGYNIKFEKVDGKDFKPSILGMSGAKKWCIIANYFDKSLIRNWLAKELSLIVEEADEWTPSYQFVDFVINGEYRGNYVVAEAIQINKNRLNIKSLEDCKTVADFETEGGFLLEIDFREEEGEHLFRSSVFEIPFSAKDPDIDDIKVKGDTEATAVLRAAAISYMKEKIDAVDAELSATNFVTKNVSEIKSFDVDSFVDWYILEEIAKSIDSDFHTSVYVYYNPVDKKIHMGPHWDFDRSLGNYSREYVAPISKSLSSTSGFWVHNHRLSTNLSYPHDYQSWFERILQNESFKVAIKTRWKEIRGGFSDICEKINDMASKLEVSASLNFTTWDILGTKIRDGEVDFAELDTYEKQINHLKTWLANRINWLDTQWGN